MPRSRSFWNSAVGIGQWNLHEVLEGAFAGGQEDHSAAWWSCWRWIAAYYSNHLLGLPDWMLLCLSVILLMADVLHYFKLFHVSLLQWQLLTSNRCYQRSWYYTGIWASSVRWQINFIFCFLVNLLCSGSSSWSSESYVHENYSSTAFPAGCSLAAVFRLRFTKLPVLKFTVLNQMPIFFLSYICLVSRGILLMFFGEKRNALSTHQNINSASDCYPTFSSRQSLH